MDLRDISLLELEEAAQTFRDLNMIAKARSLFTPTPVGEPTIPNSALTDDTLVSDLRFLIPKLLGISSSDKMIY